MARPKNRSMEDIAPARSAVRWKPGGYVRLSREDINRGKDESNSIVHQKRLLDDYCRQHPDEFPCGWEPYIDDGFTGTDTNREGFQRLLADIYARKINCVIVKDLSRLSRNYAEAGTLIENLFVQMSVRFISLAEGIDSYKNPDSVSGILVPITNVINDQYCYQTSKKIRQVFDNKRRNGEFIGAFAAYGYVKNPSDRHSLLIDEEAAETVRSIYARFLGGMSKSAIVRALNDQGVLCPLEYKRSKGLNYQNAQSGDRPLWTLQTLSGILKNPLYAGDLVQGRHRIKSYKVHVQEQVPQSEWFVVKNTHEPIIERAVFEQAQELLKRDTRTAPQKNELYLFSGFLRCADCGKAMGRSEVKSNVYYFCRTYKDQSKTACTKHSIRHDRLEPAVLNAIRQQVYLAVRSADVMAEIDAAPPQKSRSARLDGIIKAKEKQLASIMRYKQAIYQDWKDVAITFEDYCHMGEDYERQAAEIRAVLERLIAERAALENGMDDENPCLSAFRSCRNIDKLSRDVLIALVDQIKIHENGNISVKFQFADLFS